MDWEIDKRKIVKAVVDSLLKLPFLVAFFLRSKFGSSHFLVLGRKDKKMKNIRTKKSNRETYRYYFVNGERSEIAVSDEVSPSDIELLHQFDDEEVNAEHRNQYRGTVYLEEVFQYQHNEIIPELIDKRDALYTILDGDGMQERERLFEALHEAILNLTPKQQQTINKIFYQEMNQSELARQEKVSETAIRHRLEKIFNNLRKNILKGGSNLANFSVNK